MKDNRPDDSVKIGHTFVLLLFLIFGLSSNARPAATAADIPIAIRGLFYESTYQMAIGELAKIGAPAVPALLEVLKQDNEKVRSHAVDALERMGSVAAPAVPALIEILRANTKDESLALRVFRALLKIAPSDPSVLETVTSTAMENPFQFVRREAQDLIFKSDTEVGSIMPKLREALGNSSEAKRSGAAEMLDRMCEKAAPAAPELAKVLLDQNLQVAEHAARSLADLGWDMSAVVPELIKLLQNPSAKDRQRALTILSYIGPPAAPAVPELIKALNDFPPAFRPLVIEALGNIGPEARPAIKPLTEVLRGPSLESRIAAAEALGNISLDAAGSIPALIEALKVKNDTLHTTAAEALAKFGPDAWTALAPVMEMREDSQTFWETDAANKAIQATGEAGLLHLLRRISEGDCSAYEELFTPQEIGPDVRDRLVTVLTKGLTDAKCPAAFAAAKTLSELNPQAKGTAPALMEFVQKTKMEDNVAWWAIYALGELGPDAAPAAPLLTELLRHPPNWIKDSPDAMSALIIALAHIGPAAKEAAPLLLEKIKDKSFKVQYHAAWAVFMVDPPLYDPFPILLKVLDNHEREIELEAIYILQDIGPAAKPALPALTKRMLGKGHPTVRIEAAYAIHLIDPSDPQVLPFMLQAVQPDWRECVTYSRTSPYRMSDQKLAAMRLLVMKEKDPKNLPALLNVLRLGDDATNAYVYQTVAALGKPAFQPVRSMLDEDNIKAQISALFTLSFMGSEAAEAAPRVMQFLSAKHYRLRAVAARALWKIGPAAKAAGPQLVRMLATDVAWVRLRAANALGTIGADPSLVIPALVKAAADEVGSVRLAAVDSLGKLKIRKQLVIDTLEAALKDPDPRIPLAAEAALKKLRK